MAAAVFVVVAFPRVRHCFERSDRRTKYQIAVVYVVSGTPLLCFGSIGIVGIYAHRCTVAEHIPLDTVVINQKTLVVADVALHGKSALLEVVDALAGFGAVARTGKCRHEDRRKDRNNGYNYQKFDQRKTFFHVPSKWLCIGSEAARVVPEAVPAFVERG